MAIDTGTLSLVLATLSLTGAVACLLVLSRMRRKMIREQRALAEQLANIDRQLAALHPPLATQSLRPAASAATTSEQDELLAAVTAAAAAVSERKIHIRAIRQIALDTDNASAWSQQGRVVVQGSHNLSSRR